MDPLTPAATLAPTTLIPTTSPFPSLTPTITTALSPSLTTPNPSSVPTSSPSPSPLSPAAPDPPPGLPFIILAAGIGLTMLAILAHHLLTRWRERRARKGYKGVGSGWGIRRAGAVRRPRAGAVTVGVEGDGRWARGPGRARREEDLWASD